MRQLRERPVCSYQSVGNVVLLGGEEILISAQIFNDYSHMEQPKKDVRK